MALTGMATAQARGHKGKWRFWQFFRPNACMAIVCDLSFVGDVPHVAMHFTSLCVTIPIEYSGKGQINIRAVGNPG